MGSAEGGNSLIHFGPFELDPDAEQLRERGVVLKLQPQQFVVLLMLAQRAGEIVTRQEIQQHVWGDGTFVDFNRAINYCINQIRSALGDDAERLATSKPFPGAVTNSWHRLKSGCLRGFHRASLPVLLPEQTLQNRTLRNKRRTSVRCPIREPGPGLPLLPDSSSYLARHYSITADGKLAVRPRLNLAP